jgi:anti-sigma28 factor (negative regulator of flagellin synthesis)
VKINDNYQNIQNNFAYVNANNAAAASKVASEKDGSTDSSVKVEATTPNTDRVELSSDAKVTNKMSDADRAALVESLKSDLNTQTTRFTNMMMQMFNKQGITGLQAGSDAFWRQIASGNYTVDAQTKAEAQQAISEDGYWGVKQTSQRIFDMAKAIAGDDTEMMKKMQNAIEKGFEQATAAWGKELPGICGETHTAINGMFDEYYKNAGVA